MTFIQEIAKLLGKDIFVWYDKKEYQIPLKLFISLPEIFQYPIVQLYIIEKYNIGIHFDIGSVIAYWYNPELAYNQIRTASIKHNKMTTTILTMYDLEVKSFEDSYKRALLETINIILNPF